MEKVLLVVIDYKRPTGWSAEDIADELKELVDGCRGETVETFICRLEKPSAPYLIGKGKVDEIAGMCGMIDVDTVIFSQDLKGNQQRNLEEKLKVKTIDRTQLILDIFARHATSQEGKMQVELAQLEYLLPRLVGKGIALSRLGGGIGTLGPGETKLEVDRRRILERVGKLKRKLKDVVSSRSLTRKRRRDKGVPVISMVGYTNAGKSTLFNVLTQADQVVRDGLFTTLDSLSRQMVLPSRQKVVVSDTVGLMHELPHHLIESFKATLEEVKEADLLLHVLDVSCPNFRQRYEAVLEVSRELEVAGRPVITVLNKIDLCEDRSFLTGLDRIVNNPVAISAKNGENFEALVDAVSKQLAALIVEIDVKIPIGRMDLVNLAHEQGQVYSVKYYNDSIHLRGSLPARFAGVFLKENLG
ncbi:MAG: GTPase HflX [Candidatus Omnitrophica bacterium]|nr:GTPase HflX [Candidatus Omnitrophota bacterium]